MVCTMVGLLWAQFPGRDPGNEGADEGEARGRGVRRPRHGMARILRPDGSTADATSQIPHTSQARDLGEEVSRARRWAGGRVTQKKYRLPIKQLPDGTVAGNPRG